MTEELLVRRDGATGLLSLNRPKALHALTLPMVQAMAAALIKWREDPSVQLVIIDHHAPPNTDPKLSRGFCAGGDIALLRNSALQDGGTAGRAFFFAEYQLNHLIMTYDKPVVAFIDGITMGGGVGISAPASYRIATENTRFAMPETGIGLFPDVGGGWHLSRLAGRLGQYLALTGARLDGAECLWAGLATHYLASSILPQVKRRLALDPGGIDAILQEYALPAPTPESAVVAPDISRLFASDVYEDILAALACDASPFAQATADVLSTKSPQACKVSLRQLATSIDLPDFAANMRMEYRIASRVLCLPDFVEGVRAVIVEKDNRPAWCPQNPAQVTNAVLDEIFAPLPPDDEWKPL